MNEDTKHTDVETSVTQPVVLYPIDKSSNNYLHTNTYAKRKEYNAADHQGDSHRPRTILILIIFFILPTTISALYLFVVASDRYVSETRFLVRSVAAGSTDPSALITGSGLTGAGDETHVVNEYLLSRDALKDLVSNADIRKVYDRPEADIINRFPNFYSSDTFEALYHYYRSMVLAEVDSSSNISTMWVTAFRREDAQSTATALLKSAESLVNRLDQRAHEKELEFAIRSVADMKERLAQAEVELSNYRNASGIVDPTGEMTAAMMERTRIEIELGKAETSLRSQEILTPNSPKLESIQELIKSLRNQVQEDAARITGSSSSLASKLPTFERLSLNRDIAARALASAELSRESASRDVMKQHLYLQIVVAPNQPDQHAYPLRLLDFFLCMAGFSLLAHIVRWFHLIIEEHQL